MILTLFVAPLLSLDALPFWLALALPVVGIGLGRILGGIGSVIAAPFTGGSSLAALPAILGGAAEALGGATAGAAEGRRSEDQDVLSFLLRRAELEESQRQAQAQEQRQALSDAARLSFATQGTRATPYEIPAASYGGGRLGAISGALPTIGGGLQLEGGDELLQMLLQRAQTSPAAPTALPDPRSAIRGPSAWERIGNVGGIAAGLGSLLMPRQDEGAS